jgi:hypothetical protein
MKLPRVLAFVAGLFLVVSSTRVVEACSICRCGDPTFNALGSDSYHAEGFRAAFDWERFDKSQGDPAVEAEGVVENRFTALLSYGFNDRLAVTGRIPFSHRNLVATEEGVAGDPTTSNGLSDPEFYAQFRLWSSPFGPGLGRRSSISLIGGVKTAWGQNDKRDANGDRLDEHAQPGTGSTDEFGGVSWLYLFNKDSALFVSAQYRHPGENDFGYRYGRTILGNVAYEHKLGSRVDGVIELNGRHAKRDTVDALGTVDDDTGGTLLYVTPRILVSVAKSVVLRAAVQIPIVKDLYGTQEERTVFNAGITYLFGR